MTRLKYFRGLWIEYETMRAINRAESDARWVRSRDKDADLVVSAVAGLTKKEQKRLRAETHTARMRLQEARAKKLRRQRRQRHERRLQDDRQRFRASGTDYVRTIPDENGSYWVW